MCQRDFLGLEGKDEKFQCGVLIKKLKTNEK